MIVRTKFWVIAAIYMAMTVLSQAQIEQVPAVTDTSAVDMIDDRYEYTRPVYHYDSAGKRDPFESLVPTAADEENQVKRQFEYEDATILGIVESEEDTYALVMDDANQSYVLRVGDQVLGGYVTGIADNSVLMYIVKYGRPMNIRLRMESSKYTVVEQYDGETQMSLPGLNVRYEQGPLTTRGVLIEEVTLPIDEVQTVEEVWFGTRDPLYDMIDTQTSPEFSDIVGTVTLIEPQQESWIRLPYIVDWTSPEDVLSFTLLIDDTPDFSSPVFTKEDIRTSSYMINADLGLPANQVLYWRVDAIGDAGLNYATKPELMSFQIIGQ